MELTFILSNLQGTGGLAPAGLDTLAALAAEASAMALLELIVCHPKNGHQIARRFTDPLGEIAGRANSHPGSKQFFYPLYRSQASPLSPKWARLPARISGDDDAIEKAASGIGLLVSDELLPLFIPAPFRPKAEPYCGYLSSGRADRSTLIYRGGRDSELRAAVFCRFPFADDRDLLACFTHLTTLYGERAGSASSVQQTLASQIRAHQCREIVSALDYFTDLDAARGRGLELLVMGDFNCEPNALEVEALRKRLECVYERCCRSYPPTKNPGGRCLDQAWVSGGVEVNRVATVGIAGSDHEAVVVEISSRSASQPTV